MWWTLNSDVLIAFYYIFVCAGLLATAKKQNEAVGRALEAVRLDWIQKQLGQEKKGGGGGGGGDVSEDGGGGDAGAQQSHAADGGGGS